MKKRIGPPPPATADFFYHHPLTSYGYHVPKCSCCRVCPFAEFQTWYWAREREKKAKESKC